MDSCSKFVCHGEESDGDGGVANRDVMCVAMKTGVSVPHLVSNHPLSCTPPSAWHCALSVRTYGFSQKARYVDGQTWVRPFIKRVLAGD
jgi:hypothetical protein